MPPNKVPDDPGGNEIRYSPEELNLLVAKCINDDTILESLLNELGDIGEGPIKFVKNAYETELLKVIKAGIKNEMTQLVVDGNTKFIKESRNGLTLDSEYFLQWTKKLTDNGIGLDDDRLNNWENDFGRFSNLLENRFVDIGPEQNLKNLIVEWFEAGEMSLDVWKTWVNWFIERTRNNGQINLSTLRGIQWPPSSPKDTIKPKFLKALEAITLDDFLEKDGLQKFLQLQLEEPTIEVEAIQFKDADNQVSYIKTSTLNVSGRTIFLSLIKDRLEAFMENMKQVDIVARNALFVDCDLDGYLWQGKNIAIVADKVNVCGDYTFDVSGKGYVNNVELRCAADGRSGSGGNPGKNGENGRDGRAGESSGGITIVTPVMSNPEKLTLKLVGGNGENGESGGAGGDGQDGVGITQDELDQICVKYYSLYRTSYNFKYFVEYDPEGWTRTTHKYSYISEYVHSIFEDEHGRKMYYDVGADKGWIYSWIELILYVTGTDGTPGGIGGLNGKGGEGGNQGECVVINPDNGFEHPINKIQQNGTNGLDGKVGACGKSGINGNHMAMIDRSAQGSNKFYYGQDGNRRLSISYYRENDKYRRINRYRYVAEGNSACYLEFDYGTLPEGGLREQQRQKKEERSSEAQMKMKQSVVLSKVMQKAQEYRTRADSALEAANVSMNSNANQAYQAEEQAEEEEESAEEQHEVVIVKEVYEDELDSLNARGRKCKISPKQYVENVIRQPYKSACVYTQQVIDFFSIEFDRAAFVEFRLLSLKKSFQFRKIFSDSATDHFQKIVVAAVQAKKKGFKLTELEHLAQSVIDKRTKKKEITYFRAKVADFSSQCHTAQVDVDASVEKVNDKIHKVKFVDPEEGLPWHFDAPADHVQKLLNDFFKDYKLNAANYPVLEAIDSVFNQVEPKYSSELAIFEQPKLVWGDPESWNGYKESLTEADPNVKKLIKVIHNDKKWLKKTFHPFSKLFKGTGKVDQGLNVELIELNERFGGAPDFGKGLEAARYLIRFYWQMKKLLEFNRRLLIVTLLYSGETDGSKFAVLKSYQTLQIDTLIKTANYKKINLGSDASEKYMLAKKFQSMAFRYLFSELSGVHIELYGNEKYGTVNLMEDTGKTNSELIQLYHDGDRFYNIVADVDLRKLLKAREFSSWDAEFAENRQRIKALSFDYSKQTDVNNFVSFFPSVFASAVLEWFDCYRKATGNDLLLKMLHERFEVDGNHLEIADFQFIISTVMLLQHEFEVSPEFVLNYASSIPQAKLVDAFVLLRIESQWRTQLRKAPEVLTLLNSITNNRFKILLVTKLGANKVDEDQLLKMLIMFRHTSSKNTELEKMTLPQFISASEKQELMELSSDIKNLGKIGYYIIYLRQQRKLYEAEQLEIMFTQKNVVYHIPEKLIALACTLITSGEIDFDDEYHSSLKQLLEAVTTKSGLQKTNEHLIITDETQQGFMIDKVAETDVFKKVISEKHRNLEVIAGLIRGIAESAEQIADRRKTSLEMVAVISDGSAETVKLLNKINDCIHRIRGVRLRDTQKMAVIYAVQSDSNVLAQVNTGEGKSYIVTATAIIRAKQYRFVDIITSSPVLAQRDADEMKDIYNAMNVSVDHNCHEEMESRKAAYKANVVYGEISRFQKDYLLHDFYRKNILGERDRSHGCVIVDEVDNMLLDNGNNMLYLSHSVPGMDLLEPLFVHIERVICSPNIREDKDKAFATETIEAGILADLLGRFPKEDIPKLAISKAAKSNTFTIWSKLIEAHIIDSDGYLMIDNDSNFESRKDELTQILHQATTDNHAMKILVCLKAIVNRPREIEIPRYLIPFIRRHLTDYIENAKRALFMKPNEAYVVDTDRTGLDSDLAPKVTIIDQNTGIDLATSQWSEGLHQFVQIKHGCRTNPISMKAVFVSNVNYLKGYKKINGLSGTLGSEKESNTLVDLYKADLIKIPTFKAKKLYEHVPVITNNEEKWLDALFDEFADQVKAKRSVLIICQSISKVMTVEDGLLKRYNANRADKVDLDCYKEENMVVYKREHDDFDFGETDKLEPGRLILATNLAGRGTDIKLSNELKRAGGLHVIVSFLPKNSRIEDQAYGRAARCGDPGSGQIIALSDQTDASGEPPTVFDLKLFRDNAEVQRLQSLTSHYNYHTKIEEDCLTAFKSHCLEALTLMNNSAKSGDGVPTEAEIVYFALLDEWALWLDSQAAAIKQCAKDLSDSQRSDIIASVKSFLDDHPITPIDDALDWINCPQPMLALGVYNFDQGNLDTASRIFQEVIDKFPQFTGDASYYLGIIAQKDVRRVKICNKASEEGRNWFTKSVVQAFNDVTDFSDEALTPLRDGLPDSLCEINDTKRIETEDHFLQAIQGFNRRVERKKEQGTIISRLQQTVGPQIIKSDGFQRQADDMTNVYDSLCTSAYDMIGHPISYATIGSSNNIEKQFESQTIFLKCLREGYITGKAVNHNILDDQCEVIKKKYLLSKKKLQKVFKGMVEADPGSRIEFYDRTYLQEHIIRQQCRLPKREEFWGFLASFSCFSEHQEFYILNTDGVDGYIQELQSINCIRAPLSSPLRIQLSDYDLSTKKLYDSKEVERAFEENKAKLKWLIDMKYLIKDASGIINRTEFDKTAFMPNFDYFTDEDIADWLEIPEEHAAWIVDRLLMTGTLREEIDIMTKINPEPKELSPELKEKYNALLTDKSLQKLDDVNFDVIKELFGCTDKEADFMMVELTDAKILIPKRTRFVFQAMDDLDVSPLPKCLHSSVEVFLYHKFSYTFAYNALRQSLDAAMADPNHDEPKRIMLAWKPHEELMYDLMKYGFIHDHKLELREKDYLNDEMQKSLEKIESKTKPRLFIKSGTLMSTKKFFKDEGVAAGADVQTQAINHIRQVGKIGENNSWIFWMVLKVVFAIFIAWSITGLPMLALDIVINFQSYFQTSLLVIAAVGTMLYFIQSVKAKYKTQTGRDNPKERYTMLLDFHHTNVVMNKEHLKESKLAQIITTSIASRLDTMFKDIFANRSQFEQYGVKLLNSLKLSNLGPRRFTRLVNLFLDQPHNWRLFHESVRDILTRIKPILCSHYYKILDENSSTDGFDIDAAMVACKLLDEKSFKITRVESSLLTSLIRKIYEDAVVILEEAMKTHAVEGAESTLLIEPGEDPVREKIPDEFLEPGFEIDINSNSDMFVDQRCSATARNHDTPEANVTDQDYNDAIGSFVALLISRADDVYELEITSTVSKPLLSTFTNYITAANDKSEKPTGFNAFFKSEVDEKYDIECRKKQVVAHQSMSFVVNDLQEIVRQKYADDPNDDLLEMVIRYGHAMKPQTMKRLVQVLFPVFKTYLPHLNAVEAKFSKDELEFSSSTKKQYDKPPLIISLETSQGNFYLCQEDSRKIFHNKKDTDYVKSCLFESIALHNPELSEIIKQGADVFRELLLQHVHNAPAQEQQLPTVKPDVDSLPSTVKNTEKGTNEGFLNSVRSKASKVKNFFKRKK